MHNQQKFLGWIESSLPLGIEIPDPIQLDALAGDAGFRRYFRVNTSPSLIAVDSPPTKEKNLAYVDISLFLKSQGIRTPKIHAVNFELGYFLLEDFGQVLFAHQVEKNSADILYDEAQKTLLEIQQASPAAPAIPYHDADKLYEEMALFERWFLNELLDIQLVADEKKQLKNLFHCLIESALEQPQVLVHTDYHSRNLMVLEDKALGVIDFQDAMYGAITYDLVSLLKDCYIKWPDLKLSEEARKITRFDDKKYNKLAQDPKRVLQEFESYLYDEDYIIVGQNLLGFDVETIQKFYRRQVDRK